MGRVKRKSAFDMRKIRRFRSSCAWTKYEYHPGICFPFIHSVVANDSVSRQRMRRLIWAFAVCICLKTRFGMARIILFADVTKMYKVMCDTNDTVVGQSDAYWKNRSLPGVSVSLFPWNKSAFLLFLESKSWFYIFSSSQRLPFFPCCLHFQTFSLFPWNKRPYPPCSPKLLRGPQKQRQCKLWFVTFRCPSLVHWRGLILHHENMPI